MALTYSEGKNKAALMLGRKEKILVFAPLLLYLGYLWHLAADASRPFLVKWLEGSFGLFVALVFCNILRRGLASGGDEDTGGDGGGGSSESGS